MLISIEKGAAPLIYPNSIAWNTWINVKGVPKILGFVDGPGYPGQSGIESLACNAVRATTGESRYLSSTVQHPSICYSDY